jgi:hypothetical protein
VEDDGLYIVTLTDGTSRDGKCGNFVDLLHGPKSVVDAAFTLDEKYLVALIQPHGLAFYSVLPPKFIQECVFYASQCAVSFDLFEGFEAIRIWLDNGHRVFYSIPEYLEPSEQSPKGLLPADPAAQRFIELVEKGPTMSPERELLKPPTPPSDIIEWAQLVANDAAALRKRQQLLEEKKQEIAQKINRIRPLEQFIGERLPEIRGRIADMRRRIQTIIDFQDAKNAGKELDRTARSWHALKDRVRRLRFEERQVRQIDNSVVQLFFAKRFLDRIERWNQFIEGNSRP